jgi:hypothetical protein
LVANQVLLLQDRLVETYVLLLLTHVLLFLLQDRLVATQVLQHLKDGLVAN